jgi:hypothetical protein
VKIGVDNATAMRYIGVMMNHSNEVKKYLSERAAIAGCAGKGKCKRRGDSEYYADLGRKGAAVKKAKRGCCTCGNYYTDCFGWPGYVQCPNWIKP